MNTAQQSRNQKTRADELICARFGAQPSGCRAPVAGRSLNSEPHHRRRRGRRARSGKWRM